MDIGKRYERAREIYRTAEQKSTLNEAVNQKWCTSSDDFWYARDIVENDEIVTKYTRFIAAENKQAQLFCHDKMAELIEPLVEKKSEKYKLPVEIHEVDDKEGKIYLNITDVVGEYVYDTEAGTLTLLRFPLHDKYEVTSPDRSVSVLVRQFNLFMRCNKTGKETQLTHDGEQGVEYGKGWGAVSWKLLGKPQLGGRPGIVFSPDSRYFLTYRNDMRLQKHMHLIQSAPLGDDPRPVHVSYPYPVPGDENTYNGQLYIGNVKDKAVKKVRYEDGSAVGLLGSSMFGPDSESLRWTKDGTFAWLLHSDRCYKRASFVLVDAEAATARVPVYDDYETCSFIDWYGAASQEEFQGASIYFLKDTKEIIWHSEKENWGSFYLYSSETGELKRRLTGDGWVARRVKWLDEPNRMLYFTASGREEGIDPYLQNLYSVHLDTGEITRITHEHAEHYVRFAPSGAYFIDTYSLVNTIPETVVRSSAGQKLADIATADISRILEKGFQFPEPFEVLARDGKTKLYGILLKPHGFDPEKKYPVINYVYGGNQRICTPKAFKYWTGFSADPQSGIQTAAQLGFVSVIMDGFGTPLRSKEMHDVGYGRTEECCGLTDDIAGIRQLSERYSWIDIDRVGIWGASGGGYATARALLQFPDFYKVGVSLCGNHDQSIYNANWGERWMGEYSKEGYKNQANHSIAANLKGKLLLVHGDLDDNVHPSATIRLVAALIENNKDFEFLYYPNADHALGRYPYITRKRWDFFVRHLLGETPPEDFTLVEKKDEEKKS